VTTRPPFGTAQYPATVAVVIQVEHADGTIDELEATDIRGPVTTDSADLTPPPDVTDLLTDAPVIRPAGPWQFSLTVTAGHFTYCEDLHPLDSRLMQLTDAMHDDDREAIRAELARLREVLRGADYYPDIADALEVVEEAARSIRALLSDMVR
jgi:hypothetical protein